MENDKNYLLLGLTLLSAALVSGCSTNLTEVEKEGIKYVREIEKMARDVYSYFYDLWETAIMNTISQSEQVHMDTIKPLIDGYGLDDPAEGKGAGEFINQDLQQLYYDLTSQGSSSETDALIVASKIEEIDILDIKNYLEQTDEKDIDNAYNSLIEGSSNHLRIFVSHLSDKGVEYQPYYLSQQDYDDIINR